jgi:dihydrofolate reductase
VTEGVAQAIDRAKQASAGKTVAVCGGPVLVRQVIEAGLLDEIQVHIAPVLLGTGMRLFDSLSHRVELTQTGLTRSARATHLTYTIQRVG